MGELRLYNSKFVAYHGKEVDVRLVEVGNRYFAPRADLVEIALSVGGVRITIGTNDLENHFKKRHGRTEPVLRKMGDLSDSCPSAFIRSSMVMIEQKNWWPFLRLHCVDWDNNAEIAIINKRKAHPVRPLTQDETLQAQVNRLQRRVRNLELAMIEYLTTGKVRTDLISEDESGEKDQSRPPLSAQ